VMSKGPGRKESEGKGREGKESKKTILIGSSVTAVWGPVF